MKARPESREPFADALDLREALDRIGDGVIVFDRDWRFVYLNRGAAEYFQRPREGLLGKIVWEEFPMAVGTEIAEVMRRAAETGETVEIETLAPAMKRWVAFRIFPSEKGVSIAFRDVTEKKTMTDALRTSEARYRAMFEHAVEGILRTSPDGRILAANPAACRMLGRTEAEICAVGRAGIVDANDPRLAAALEERRRAGHVRAELTFVRRDGTKLPVEISSAIYRDADGNERTIMTMIDLTEKKRAEDRLRLIGDAGAVLGSKLEAEATLHDLTRLLVPRFADLCILDLVEDGSLRRVAVSHRDREREAAILGVGALGPIAEGKGGVFAVARTGNAELVPVVDEAWLHATTRDAAHFEIARAVSPRSGIVVPVARDGKVIGVLTLAILDESRRYGPSDLETAKAIADRAALAIENARLYEQTVQAKRLRDDVLGVVSHDLRNPLNVIRINARVLARAKGEAEELAAIDRAVVRADALIHDLLTAAALDAGHMPLQKERCELGAIVDEALALHRAPAALRSLELAVAIAPDVPSVLVDRSRLLQVLGNLLDNAVKHTADGGRIAVEAARDGGSVVVRVSDTGRGIPADALPRVFDRWWQVASTKRAGAGLGLAIAKGVVDAHGGTIGVASVEGKGTTFTFTLPLDAPA